MMTNIHGGIHEIKTFLWHLNGYSKLFLPFAVFPMKELFQARTEANRGLLGVDKCLIIEISTLRNNECNHFNHQLMESIFKEEIIVCVICTRYSPFLYYCLR